MSKLSSKSIEWLKDAEQKYIVNMPEVTEENRSRVKFMQDGLKAVREELAIRLIQQKKSEVQPIEKVEQLPQKIERAVLNPSNGIPALNETPEKLKADSSNQESDRFEFTPTGQTTYIGKTEKIRELSGSYQGETRVLAKIQDPEPIAVPVVQIEFKDGHRELNQGEIMSLLKTYFKRVATSAGMEAGRYSNVYNSNMGKTVYKLFQGWNTIYNETQEGAAWPPLENCFPGFGRASQNQKVNAEILWRWASKNNPE